MRPGCWSSCAPAVPDRRAGPGGVAVRRPYDVGADRCLLGRRLLGRPAGGRPARPDRGHDRRGQVRAAADDDRVPGRGQPAGRDDVRADRLQGRRGVRGLRVAAPRRRDGDRPGRPPDRTRPGVTGRRTPPARVPPAARGRQGHRGLLRAVRRGRTPRVRTRAPAGPGHRRVRGDGGRAAGLRGGPGRHRPPRPLPGRPPAAGHPAPGGRGDRRHPREHQPPHRPARHRPGRVDGRAGRPRRRAHLQVDAGPLLRTLGRGRAGGRTGGAGRRAAAGQRVVGPGPGGATAVVPPGPPARPCGARRGRACDGDGPEGAGGRRRGGLRPRGHRGTGPAVAELRCRRR